ncbi:uncharacterized protein LOC105188734 [Harpegnathos saltator]|uniref:uncharacterized protein LOC105188734 n=1 Tax=Harpegnathos saltator TaxID=610380 RepID=UPI00058FE9A9|nr:uncharacterized protein LOC105188734 [Harpegnathos saltator]
MAIEKISLYDPLNDTLVEVNLLTEEATRAKNDMIFATSLMNAALKEQQSLKITSDPLLSRAVASEQQENSQEFQVVNITDKENVSNLNLDDGGCFYRWTTSCVLLLLETYKANENKFINGKQSQKKTWEEVSETLKCNGHDVTGPMCAEEFEKDLQSSQRS